MPPNGNPNDPWAASWNSRNKDLTGRDWKQAAESSNPIGWAWGGLSGGKKDPVQAALDGGQDYGDVPWTDNDAMVYSQMDQDQWNELQGLRQENQKQWIKNRALELATGKGRPAGKFWNPQTGQTEAGTDPRAGMDAKAQAAKEAAFQQWRQNTMQRLDAFSKEMGMPVEELIKRGDLGVMNAGNNAISSAGSAAYRAGLDSGGVSSMNTQRAVTDAQAKYQLQRQQLGLSATQGLLGEMGNMAHEGEDTRRYEQGMNLQLQQANEQARQRAFGEGQARQGQMFGMIGGLAGGMYAGPQGAAFGSQLGQGLGGYSYGQYKPHNMSYPGGSTAPGSGGYGLGGNNRYGGSQ